jgi:actin-like protein 6A
VHDGFLLKKSIVKSPIAGQYLTKCMQQAIEHKKVKLRPRYSFKRVENEKTGAVTVKDVNCANVTDSFKAYHVAAICEDAKHTVCRQLSDTPFSPEDNANIPNVTYELPDGQEISIGTPRFTIPEILFKPGAAADRGRLDQQVRYRREEGAVQQHPVDGWKLDVRIHSETLGGGLAAVGALHDEIQGDGAGEHGGAQVLCVDRRVDPLLAGDVPADVAVKGRVQRVRRRVHPQKSAIGGLTDCNARKKDHIHHSIRLPSHAMSVPDCAI